MLCRALQVGPFSIGYWVLYSQMTLQMAAVFYVSLPLRILFLGRDAQSASKGETYF